MATEMSFEKGKVYEFELDRSVIFHDKKYLMLTYGPEKTKTMPEYKDDHWQFRVEVPEAQTNWNSLPQGTKIACYVKDYIHDDGKTTTFPFLVQDISGLLKEYYKPGATYTFTVAERQHSTNPSLNWYTLTDGYGFSHSYPTGNELEPGTEIDLTVDKVSYKLEFVNEVKKKIQENFQIGKEYEFEIVDKVTDSSKSPKSFYILKDFICNYNIHRFYYEGQLSKSDTEGTEDKDPKYTIGSKIKLLVQKFMPNGWPCLTLPKKKFNEEQLKSFEELPIGLLGLENNTREYKSSIVYTGDGEPAINTQLGIVIMKEIASFMNSSGGTLILGVRDDGKPVGIEQDLPLLQTGDDLPPGYKYSPNLDSYERRIRQMVITVLGGTANSLLDNSFEFIKVTDDDTPCTICTIKIPRSTWPIYMNGTTLYKRCGNMCQKLLGNDITFFIRERMLGVDVNQPEPETITNQAKAAAPVVELPFKAEPVSAENKTIQIVPKKTLSGKGVYFTFLKNENKFLYDTKPYQEDKTNVLHEIFVDNVYKKKSGYLLMGYANGRVRFRNPGLILQDRQKKYAYSNGYSMEAEFKWIETCSKNDYLVVRSTDPDGRHWIKATPIDVYSYGNNGKSMASKGNMIVNENLAKVDSMEIVSEESGSYILPIIQKYRTTTPGFPADDLRYAAAVTYLDNHGKNNAPDTAVKE